MKHTPHLQSLICSSLRQEIQKATGCTEIAAAALVAAKAAETLGLPPTTLRLSVSPNIYKNGAFAGVPGMPVPGFKSAVSLGSVLAKSSQGLNLLDSVSSHEIANAKQFMNNIDIDVRFAPSPHAIYLHCDAQSGSTKASATILGSHDYFTNITQNGVQIYSQPIPQSVHDSHCIQNIPIRDLLSCTLGIPLSKLEVLRDAANINSDVCPPHRIPEHQKIARALHAIAESSPNCAAKAAQALAGSASEARMTGSTTPVIALCGSGNHGLANFLGVLGVAQSLGSSPDMTLRALAISSIVTIAIKAHTGKLTAFCGCAIAPATGLAAATVYLLGGKSKIMENAMNSVIATFAGMLCDGAKTSCAFKVSAVVGAAVDMARMAMQGAFVPEGSGILGDDIDETLTNLAILNSRGMIATEEVVLSMIQPQS